MQKMDGLIGYMEKLEKDLQVSIVIKDFVGFLEPDTGTYVGLSKFWVHRSDYCMFVKEQSHLWHQCLNGKKLLYDKLVRSRQPYFGCCYAGIGEYVVPIFADDFGEEKLIGAITVGGFNHPKWSEKKESLSNLYHIDTEEAAYRYEGSTHPNVYEVEDILEKTQVISEYLGLIYASKLHEDEHLDHGITVNNYIISHAMAYLDKHYLDLVTLKDIAQFCHCSTSYISHNFSKMVGVSVPGYINRKRIESAKILLGKDSLGITDIGYKVGYKDSNYFSKVFKELVGIPPLTFRQQGS